MQINQSTKHAFTILDCGTCKFQDNFDIFCTFAGGFYKVRSPLLSCKTKAMPRKKIDEGSCDTKRCYVKRFTFLQGPYKIKLFVY